MLPWHPLSFYLKQCQQFLGEGSCLLIIVHVLYVTDSTVSIRDGQLQYGIFLVRENLFWGSELLRRNYVNVKLLVTLKNKAWIEKTAEFWDAKSRRFWWHFSELLNVIIPKVHKSLEFSETKPKHFCLPFYSLFLNLFFLLAI